MAVYIAKDNTDIKQAIRLIINHFKEKIDFSKSIFLKPNIVFPVKENSGEITRHKIVRALIEVLRENDDKIDIIIGEGTAAGSNPEENFKVSGYSKLAKDLGVWLLNLDEVERVKVRWKYGAIKLPSIVFERNYINLPILKLSSAAGISGAMKNQKGLLSPKMKKGFHMLGLHEPIAYLNEVIQPALTIVDGFNFFKNNVFIAGDNTYEIDKLAIKVLKADEPGYMKIAKDIGVGKNNYKIFGNNVDGIRCNYNYKPKEYKKFFRIRLWSNPRACSMCRFLFHDIKRFSYDNMSYSIFMSLKLVKYALTGLEIIFGSKPEFKRKYQKVICIGDCTKKIAKKNEYIHVPGCPPKKEDMLKYF